MKLINFDGMAFIGPGSEWFWTALSGIVLAVTFLAIYRQLRLARSASAREQIDRFNREWDSERMIRYRLDVLVAVRDGVDAARLPEAAAVGIENFWEGVAGLARSGHLDTKTIYSNYGEVCQGWWTTLAPHVQRARTEARQPRFFSDFEWLVGAMANMDRRAGVAIGDGAGLGPLGDRIKRLEDLIRIEEALRTVIVASPRARDLLEPPASPTPVTPATT